MLRKPNGSVEEALRGRTISGVVDDYDRIELKLDNDSIVVFFKGLRQGADGGYCHELIILHNGKEIAWR